MDFVPVQQCPFRHRVGVAVSPGGSALRAENSRIPLCFDICLGNNSVCFSRWRRKLVVCPAVRRHAFLWFYFPHGLLQLLRVDGNMPVVSRDCLALYLASTACCHAPSAVGLGRTSVSCCMGGGYVRLCRFGDLDAATTQTRALSARITEPSDRQFHSRPPVQALLVT